MVNDNAERLLKQRYYQNENETWATLCERVVNHVVDNSQQMFYDDLYNLRWLPNSPCLVNAGKEKNPGLFACFVVGPGEDTLETHLDDLKEIALIAKHGGGCGFTGTNIRPEGAPVAGSSHGYAYGPNKYAESISNYMHMMTQSGFRKMALMYTLSSDHPDIEKFIELKQNRSESDLYNFNQSIFATDDFMVKGITEVGSRESNLLRTIAQNAWNNGEPGLIFDDTVNEDTPYKYSGQLIQCTNPCGLQQVRRR